MNYYACIAFSLWMLFPVFLVAQYHQIDETAAGGDYKVEQFSKSQPCISDAEYKLLEQRCQWNKSQIGLSERHLEGQIITPLLWPVKAANGLTDCSFFHISAFVDQDKATGMIKDYNCGTKTYDGHRGTDIALFPFRFIKMNNDQVQVVAAAGGTILDKVDGNFDKNCGVNALQANYIVIGHVDGSRALYFHMKKNSITPKAVGEMVLAGEYLGVVGSSGNSSGPHLHFEVWSGSTVETRIDPFSGGCNTLNTNSWWISQLPYLEPEIAKASVHTGDILVPPCPETETSNLRSCFVMPFQAVGLPAGNAKFYMFLKNETAGLQATLRILKPDGSVFSSWSHTSSNNYGTSYWAWTKLLPTTPGTYTFEIQYNGKTCSTSFDMLDAAITVPGPTIICEGDSLLLKASTAHGYKWSSGDTTQSIYAKLPGVYNVTVSSSHGCTEAAIPVMVSSLPLPDAEITINGSTAICPEDSVQLIANPASTYLWNTGATTQGITVHLPGNYTVTVTGQNGCKAVSDKIVIQQLVPIHGLHIVLLGDSLRSPYDDPNYWYLAGNFNSVDTGKVVSCDQDGGYIVSGIDMQGCRAYSDTLFQNCVMSAMDNDVTMGIIQVFPNPTYDVIYLQGSNLPNGNYHYSLNNALGQICLSGRHSVVENQLGISLRLTSLSQGMYILKVESTGMIYTIPISKID
jgi:hypothetical protein